MELLRVLGMVALGALIVAISLFMLLDNIIWAIDLRHCDDVDGYDARCHESKYP